MLARVLLAYEKAPIRCQVSPWGEKVGAIGLAFRVQYYFLEIAYPAFLESKAAAYYEIALFLPFRFPTHSTQATQGNRPRQE